MLGTIMDVRKKNQGQFSSASPRVLAAHDTVAFESYRRMDLEHFSKIVDLRSERLHKKDTVMREYVKPAEMCCLAIRYLATGESFHSLEFQFQMSRVTISKIIIEVCQALYEVMGPIYLSTPKTQEEWLKLSEKFEVQWNFPMPWGQWMGSEFSCSSHKIQAPIIMIIKVCSRIHRLCHGVKF